MDSLGAGTAAFGETGVDQEPIWSDNGNLFLDCRFEGGLPDPVALERTVMYRAGVVDTGLFLGMAAEAVVASANGVRRLSAVAAL